MQKAIRNIISAGLIALVGYLPISCASFKPRKTLIYEYALSKNLETKIASSLVKLKPLDNSQEFIDIISSYPEKLQEACVNSDILDNKHISKKELENTRKATLEGIVNPQEIYAVLANGDGRDTDGDFTTNILSFYKLLKDNNVDDDNIELLVYNPTNRNLFKTERYNCLFKRSRLTTVKNGNWVNSTVPPSKLLPTSEAQIKIDNKSTKSNFLNSIKALKSDYNDTVYIVYSAHGAYFKKADEGCVVFSGGLVKDFELNSRIRKPEYDKMFVIQDSCHAAGLLKNLNKPGKIKNTLAIASSDIDDYGGIYILGFVDDHLNNPKQSIKKIIEITSHWSTGHHPQVFYFNNEGEKRPPEECPWYNEPLIETQE